MFHLTREPIDAKRLRDALARSEDGAVVVFEGVVRSEARGRQVRFLEYEGYEAMALKKLEEIGARAQKEFAIREIGIIHRLGRMNPGECSVAIVVAAAHRAPAFDACRFAIDTIKETVPIWKKEYYEQGAAWIEGPDDAGGA